MLWPGTMRSGFVRVSGLLLLAGVCAPAAPQAAGDAWRIDPNHSAAYFSVRHLMISTVRGQFNGLTGMVHYDPAHMAAASVDASVD